MFPLGSVSCVLGTIELSPAMSQQDRVGYSFLPFSLLFQENFSIFVTELRELSALYNVYFGVMIFDCKPVSVLIVIS